MKHLRSILTGLIACSSLFFTACSSTVEVETTENFEVLELPDGSEVFLNHNSYVSYNKEFNPRNIKLDGEAFFYVVSDSSPFVVTTTLGEVKVLGTEFNVKTEEDNMEVEVEGGQVELNAGEHRKSLKKGYRGSFNKNKNTFTKGKAQFKFRQWMQQLAMEFKSIGREFKHNGKQIGEDFKQGGKEVGKEGERLGKEAGKEGKNLGKDIRKAFR